MYLYCVSDLVRNAVIAFCYISADRRMSGRRGKSGKIHVVFIIFRVCRFSYIVKYTRDHRVVDVCTVQLGKFGAAHCNAVSMRDPVRLQPVLVKSVHILAVRIEQPVLLRKRAHRVGHSAVWHTERRVYLYARRRYAYAFEFGDFDLDFALFKRLQKLCVGSKSRAKHYVKLDKRFQFVYIVPFAEPRKLLAPYHPIQVAAAVFFRKIRRCIDAVT